MRRQFKTHCESVNSAKSDKMQQGDFPEKTRAEPGIYA